jgi:sulfur carrier protein
MQVLLNDLPTEVPEPCTLLAFLQLSGLLAQRGIAVARNGSVVPRSAWDDCQLRKGDELLVIRPSQGG